MNGVIVGNKALPVIKQVISFNKMSDLGGCCANMLEIVQVCRIAGRVCCNSLERLENGSVEASFTLERILLMLVIFFLALY